MALANTEPVATLAVRARITIKSVAYDCVSITADTGDAHDAVKIVTLGAAWEISLPGAIGKTDPIEAKVLKKGAKPESGTLADLVVEIDESTNGATPTTETVTIPCAIVAVKPDSIEADGNRLQAWAVTLQPTNIGRSALATK